MQISMAETAFLQNLRENPGDETTRLVYADWLDENDQPEKANYLRNLAYTRSCYDKLKEAKNKISDRDWIDSVLSGNEEHYQAYVNKMGFNPFTLKEINSIVPSTVGMTDFNSLLGDTIKEKYEALYVRLVEIGNVVIRKSSTKQGNEWIYTSPEICSIFEVATPSWLPCPEYIPAKNLGENDPFIYKGVINKRWRVFSHLLSETSTIMIGIGNGLLPENCARLNLINFII